jgi:paraquat-inducible protein B
MRGQLRTGNLLTGQKYVAIDFFPNAPKVKVDTSKQPIEIPTVPGPLEGVEEALERILKKIEKVEFGAIGEDLRRALDSLDKTLKNTDRLAQRVDSELVDEMRSTLHAARTAIERADRSIIAPDASLQEDVREALREIARAADALRALADLLERQPESLIRGKQAE